MAKTDTCSGVYLHQSAHLFKKRDEDKGRCWLACCWGGGGRGVGEGWAGGVLTTVISFRILFSFYFSFHLQLGLSGLLIGHLWLTWTWRVVDFNHQLVDQRSQQGPGTGGHYGHPPPSIAGPAKTGCVHSASLLSHVGGTEAGVKLLTWKHPLPSPWSTWTVAARRPWPGWWRSRCWSPSRSQ